MAQENVELVRRVYERWNGGDFDAAAELLDPEVRWDGYSHLPESGTREGIDEVRSWTDAFREAWGEVRVEVEELVEIDDDSVLAFVRVTARGRGSGALVVSGLDGHIWTVRDGRVVAVRMFQGTDEAVAAAGLSR
jgi:ketosteroid isomerase-like protein